MHILQLTPKAFARLLFSCQGSRGFMMGFTFPVSVSRISRARAVAVARVFHPLYI